MDTSRAPARLAPGATAWMLLFAARRVLYPVTTCNFVAYDEGDP